MYIWFIIHYMHLTYMTYKPMLISQIGMNTYLHSNNYDWCAFDLSIHFPLLHWSCSLVSHLKQRQWCEDRGCEGHVWWLHNEMTPPLWPPLPGINKVQNGRKINLISNTGNFCRYHKFNSSLWPEGENPIYLFMGEATVTVSDLS